MTIDIVPGFALSGRFTAPPSKSYTQRAVMFGALSAGRTVIENPSLCEDVMASLGAARSLGAGICIEQGCNDRGGSPKVMIIPGAGEKKRIIDCGESGFTMRAFPALAALGECETTLLARGTLSRREIGGPEECYAALGGAYVTTGGLAPLIVRGRLRGGRARLAARGTSQNLTGLLAALCRAEAESVIEAEGLASKPYIDMTTDAGRHFGARIENENHEIFRVTPTDLQPCTFTVEGDWGLAAPFLCAAAASGDLSVRGLNPGSIQADRSILDILGLAGADFSCREHEINIRCGRLRAFSADLTDTPDLFPPAVLLAAFAEGCSVLYGSERLRNKESDRAEALAVEFSKLGTRVEILGSRMLVQGGGKLHYAECDTRRDHRIEAALAMAMAAGGSGGRLIDAGCTRKSFPEFHDVMDSLNRQSAQGI